MKTDKSISLRRTLTITNTTSTQNIWTNYRSDSFHTGFSSHNGPLLKNDANIIFSVAESIFSSPAVDKDNNLYFGSVDNNFYKITSSGSVFWKFETNADVYSSPALSFEEDIVYFGSMDRRIYALSTSTGGVLWSFLTTAGITTSPYVYKSNGQSIVFISSNDWYLYSFDGKTGKVLLWYATTSSIDYSSPIALNGVVYVGSTDHNVWAYNISNNNTARWVYSTGGAIRSSPAIDSLENTLYIGSGDFYMYAIWLTNGALRWKYFTQDRVECSPAIYGNAIYFGSNDAYFYSLSKTTGSLIWKIFREGKASLSSPALSINGLIYFGGDAINIIALNQSTGAFVWRVNVDGFIRSGPIIGKNGSLYFGTNRGSLYKINTKISPTVETQNNGLTEAQIIAIIVCVVIIFICFICIFFYGFYILCRKTSTVIVENVKAALPKKEYDDEYYQYDNFKIPKLSWNDITIDKIKDPDSLVIGKGSFGIVILGKWLQKNKKIKSNEITHSEELILTPDTNRYTIQNEQIKYENIDEENGFAIVTLNENNGNNVRNSNSDDILKSVNQTQNSNDILLSIKSVNNPVNVTESVKNDSNHNKKYKWRTTNKNYETVDIVVKVILNSIKFGNNEQDEKNKQIFDMALAEVAVVFEAESKLHIKDCITKIYGIVKGVVPQHLCKAFQIPDEYSALGIVMRYEGGGTLQNLIYKSPIPFEEKMRLLTELIKAIADMHSAGIIHGDLKPENVLLSTETPHKIRLADFGLATLRSNDTENTFNDSSSLGRTKHTRGTPIYCAPEMFPDPYSDIPTDNVAKASRKTDIYAFAIMAWEILSQKRPFVTVTSETLLVTRIYQGIRPDIKELPSECSEPIKMLISRCWHTDRMKRKSAIECFSIFLSEYVKLSSTTYDVYLSYELSNVALVKYVFYRLTQLGLKVNVILTTLELSQKESVSDHTTLSEERKSVKSNFDLNIEIGQIFNPDEDISQSCIVIAFLSQKYQENSKCMDELRYARKCKPPKPIIPIFIENDFENWANTSIDLTYLCQLRSDDTTKYDYSRYSDIEMQNSIESKDSDTKLDDDYTLFQSTQNDVDILYKHIQTLLSEQLLVQNRDAIKKAFEPNQKRNSTITSVRETDRYSIQ